MKKSRLKIPSYLKVRFVNEKKSKGRIEFLDGLRGIAILAVVFLHYFSRWTYPITNSNYYPYGSEFAGMFKYGFLGVQLFFMISGFVIFMTLEKTKSLKEFFIRRWSRLFPAMLVCSLLTFIASQTIPDYSFANHAIDLIPGWLFIRPDWLTYITGTPMDSMDTAYWTLYTEAQFYVLISILYFVFSGRNILTMMTVWYVFVFAATHLDKHFHPSHFDLTYQIRDHLINARLPWFCIGMACYEIYKRRQTWLTYGSLAVAVLFCTIFSKEFILPGMVTILIFYAPFLFPAVRKLCANHSLLYVGAASYPLYLLHQHIGVSLIKISGPYIPEAIACIVPIIILLALLPLCYAIHQYVERPAQRWIRKWAYRE